MNLIDFPLTPERKITQFKPHNFSTWHQQIYDAASVQDWKTKELKNRDPSENIEYFSNREAVIQNHSEQIRMHMDRRIQLFFQQAILCYDTPYHYDANAAEDQYGTGTVLTSNGKRIHETQAAHSSTLPCLYAYRKNENQEIIPNSKFVFLRYSNYYKQQNTTVELPAEVNRTDTELDGKSNQEKSRTYALNLLNKTAEKRYDPVTATKDFVDLLKKRLITMQNNLSRNDLRHKVSAIYLEHVQSIEVLINNRPNVFDQILGISISENPSLREIVYQKRFRLIQKAEEIENKIARRIFQCEKETTKKRIRSLKSVNFNLRYILLEKTESSFQKSFYQKLFCCSLEQLQNQREENNQRLRRFQNSVHAFYEVYKEKIHDLIIDLNVYQSQLIDLKSRYQSELFKALRTEYMNWTQREFAERFKTSYPNEPMSISMISRIEQPARNSSFNNRQTPINQRRIILSREKIMKISSVFNLDPGLFLPGLIC